ncbi:hypothetical protein M8C21_001234 [Ambrosia artemisiifolia]|uniref:Protein FAR1-RELATED SEQUENCE n=1 Tax=Ambrosia artemisiifolia TaxID=4212 RepID=A0AAD5BKU4_AMBAR|nr:hypothetical protein M8C21_001234 [Ambrosia artemisiifolia]
MMSNSISDYGNGRQHNTLYMQQEFPRQYILRRWTREDVPNTKPGSILTHNDDALLSDDVNKVVREISYATEYCTNKLLTKFDKLCSFRDYINEFMAIADEAQFDAPRKSRRDRFAELVGDTDVSTATIRVPCGKCKEYGHNSRTCGKLYPEPKEVASNKNANGKTVIDDTEDTDTSEDDELASSDEAHIEEE